MTRALRGSGPEPGAGCKTCQPLAVRCVFRIITANNEGERYRAMPAKKIARCKCGHPKSIHRRMYGSNYWKRKLPQPCNYPDCKCKQYAPVKE